MNYNKKSVADIEVSGKRVLVRCDFNVPQDENLNITDETRILGALPTIKYLKEHGAKVILCSHLGRPKGEYVAKYTLAPVAKRLGELLGCEVTMAADVVGESAKACVAALNDGDICMLENVRFEKGEQSKDKDVMAAQGKALADLAEIFVNDAFGTAHRREASTAVVADYLPAVCGFLIEKEISVMGKALDDPKRPFVAVLGGAKVSDKIGVINNLLEKVDTIIIGGAMAYTFTKATGGDIGDSRVEDDKLDYAREMIAKAEAKGVRFLLPSDNVCADHFAADATPVLKAGHDIGKGLMGLDIGPKTIETYAAAVKEAGTVVWNGPMGVFEFDAFAGGTRAVAAAIAESNAISIIGGGDSAAAVQQLGFGDKMTHISTGGGASLELLEGKTLPGIACLQDK